MKIENNLLILTPDEYQHWSMEYLKSGKARYGLNTVSFNETMFDILIEDPTPFKNKPKNKKVG